MIGHQQPLLRASLRLTLVLAIGCGAQLAPAFDPRFPDANPADTRAIAERLRSPQAGDGSPGESSLVASTQGSPAEVVLYDLARGKLRWRASVAATSRPELLGDLVLVASAGSVIGLEAQTVRERFRFALAGCSYLGAARGDQRIYFTCIDAPAPSDPGPAARLIALDAGSGAELWQRRADGALGRPATRAGLVVVPWQHQNLTIVDGARGDELARLRTRDDVIEWVQIGAAGMLFGHRRIYRLGPDGYRGGREQASGLELPSETLPGQPAPVPSAYLAEPASRSARGRIALHFAPEPVGDAGARVAGDRYYFVFYRYVFAYDASSRLLWTRVLPSDAIAGRAVPSGLLSVLEDGRIQLLGRDDGEPAAQLSVGASLAAASVAGDGPARAPDRAAQPVSLRESLTRVALDNDARLVPARSFAVAKLATLDDPLATADLLRIYEQSNAPPELKRAAADALRTRRVGLQHLIDALQWHYDFIEQSRPAPLAVIVPALMDARETRAVPGLLARLTDHETPAPVLTTLVRGIVALGDERVVDPLADWLRLYRADSSFAADPEPLLEAARGIALHGADRGKALLASLLVPGAPALAALSREVERLLHPEAEVAPDVSSAELATASSVAPLPDKLSQEAVAETFAAHTEELRACIDEQRARTPELARVRVVFIAESDGATHSLSFAPGPPALVDCLYPKVASYRFPPFEHGRQIASYTITSGVVEASPVPDANAGSDAPWWSWYASHGRRTHALSTTQPWWHSRQPLAPLVEREISRAPTPDANPPAEAVPSPAPVAQPKPNPPEPAPAEDAWWRPGK
jgi:hypothetical protein